MLIKGLGKEVIHLEYVSDKDMHFFYNALDLLVCLQLYKGFGLPLVEAMAYGVPIMASNITPMSEVVGDSELLVNPYDLNGITEALSSIMCLPIFCSNPCFSEAMP